jgi:hypothetical protein
MPADTKHLSTKAQAAKDIVDILLEISTLLVSAI